MEQNSQQMSSPVTPDSPKSGSWISRSFRPFRTATLRGLAIILPPLLTIIVFVWALNLIETYVLRPVESALTQSIVYYVEEIEENPSVEEKLASEQYTRRGDEVINSEGRTISQVSNGQWIPKEVVEVAENSPGESSLATANQYYQQYVKNKHLKRHLFVPAFLALFLAILYLLGKLMAAGIGRFFLHYVETIITQLPIIRNVYSSVKQVTDFAFNENEMSFSSIVAVEYPRKGIWSMGFVTGEGMREIRDAAGEPILTVLMPTSPMPATGFTISVPKSETIDLNITIDQAVQFCVSCGVVIPDNQQNEKTIEGEVRNRFKQIAQQSTNGNSPTDSTELDPTPVQDEA